jgi:hypothetical protein
LIPAVVKHPTLFIEIDLVVIQASRVDINLSLILTRLSWQVEETLFRVHKRSLTESTTFADMFRLSDVNQNNAAAEGSSAENPIKLSEVSALEFESLLIALYSL